MTSESKNLQAIELVQSYRGQYILSQALTVAIKVMEEVEPPHREVSNIEDMRFIRDHLFPIYAQIHEAEERAREEGLIP